MTEISRHIEILLLENDCVIVPGLGGFMAHYSSAQFIEKEDLFYPPTRKIGFNSQIQLNDSVLAQSYEEAYDISYPEAIRRITEEVEEIKQILTSEGEYEFNGIGTLKFIAEGRYDFIPCPSGLLSPSLYALNSFEINAINHSVHSKHKITRTLRPQKSSLTYNIIAAVMLLLFILSSIPVGNGSSDVEQCSMVNPEIISKIVKPNPNVSAAVCPDTLLYNKTSDADEIDKEASPRCQSNAVNNNQEQHFYVLVVAARVSRSGAKDLVAKLHKCGFTDTEISERTSNRKVIYGHYKSEDEALNALRTLKNQDITFTDAWISRI